MNSALFKLGPAIYANATDKTVCYHMLDVRVQIPVFCEGSTNEIFMTYPDDRDFLKALMDKLDHYISCSETNLEQP